MEVNMFTVNGRRLSGFVLPILLLSFAANGLATSHNRTASAVSKKLPMSLSDQVRHELLMLPYLGVFDNLSFSIDGSTTVILTGQVVRPILKSDAEGVVRRIPGVSKVVNNIEVLPLSPSDDAIRLRTYRAIFSEPGFEKYAHQAVSPIRIIVKNGNITLEGVVGNALDRTLADMAARSVLAFKVTDNLTIGYPNS
jgi:hyperosmotically inducible periplasmic protein